MQKLCVNYPLKSLRNQGQSHARLLCKSVPRLVIFICTALRESQREYDGENDLGDVQMS